MRFPMERNRGPEVGPEAELEEGEPEVKKRRLLCVEFASVASCDAAVAQCYLAENDWEMEVSFRCFSLAGSLPWWCRRTSHPCVFVLQRALNSYFEPAVEESASESRPESPSEPESWWVTTGRGSGGSSRVPGCVGHPGPAIELGGGSAQRRALGLSSRKRRVIPVIPLLPPQFLRLCS